MRYYNNYTKVRLTTDQYQDKAVSHGAIGYIIEVYEKGNYEVEFSDRETGITIAQIVVNYTEIETIDGK